MTLSIDVWSDIACPWCYVGKRRLEAALEGLEEPVALRWRAFELDPSAPRERDPGTSYAARLAAKYGRSVAEAEGMIEQMTRTAAEDGLDFRFDRIRPGNTFDAHRLLHMALEHEKQDALKERLFRAYLTEGEPIGDPDTLVRLAADVGLDAEEVRGVLGSEAFAAEVRDDEAQAAAIGIRGVPFFVFGKRLAMSGAGTPESLRETIDRALSEGALEVTEGAICGPDGC